MSAAFSLGLTKAQRELRHGKITASLAAALLGVHPTRTQSGAVAEILGLHEDDEPEDPNEITAANVGHALEEAILANLYAGPRGVQVVRGTSFVSEDRPWLLATPDGGVLGPEATLIAANTNNLPIVPLLSSWKRDVTRNLEVKVVGRFKAPDWAKAVDGIPDYVRIQTEVQMAVTGVSVTDVLMLSGTEFAVYTIESSPRLQKAILSGLEEVWCRYIQRGELPEPDGSAAYSQMITAAWPQHRAHAIIAPPDIDALGSEMAAIKVAMKDMEVREAIIEQQIKLLMQSSEAIKGTDWKATWRTAATGGTDWKAVALEFQPSKELMAKHTKPGSRRFLFTSEAQKAAKAARSTH